MTAANFQPSIDRILTFEGGYVDHPRDPGGATNMGITHHTLAAARGRPVTKAEVRALTRAEAVAIYTSRYARPIRFDDLPAGLDHLTLDGAINSGPDRGVRWLQAGLGLPPAGRDGKVGPKTLAAARTANAEAAITAAARARMGFLRGLGTWTTFGRGWSRRVADAEAFAIMLADRAVGIAPAGKLDRHAEDAEAAGTREVIKGAGAAAGGGGGIALTGLPDWATWAIAAALLAAVVIVVARWRVHADRAAAFRNLKESLT